MASNSTESQPRGSAEFVESSVLEAVVPSDSFIDLEEEISSWDGSVEEENSPILPFLSQRQVLLFGRSIKSDYLAQDVLLIHRYLDELVHVYVVFRTPLIDDVTLKAYLTRLAINLEAFAFSTAPPPEPEAKAPPPKELIYSDTIRDSNEPIIIRYEEESNPHTFVLWKVEVFISRSSVFNSIHHLTDQRSTPRKIPQTCCVFPAYSLIKASRKGKEICPRCRVPPK